MSQDKQREWYIDYAGTRTIYERAGSGFAEWLAALPQNRSLELCIGQFTSSPVDKPRPSYQEAALGYFAGRVAIKPCTKCQRSGGRFPKCVVVYDNVTGKPFFKGACCNCRYTDKQGSCSFVGKHVETSINEEPAEDEGDLGNNEWKEDDEEGGGRRNISGKSVP